MTSSTNTSFDPNRMGNVKILTFDVFGTSVHWRSSIEAALTKALEGKGENARDIDVPRFAQDWRAAYMAFTRGFEPRPGGEGGTGVGLKSVDAFFGESLRGLLEGRGFVLGDGDGDALGEGGEKGRVTGVFTEREVDELAWAWRKSFFFFLWVVCLGVGVLWFLLL